MYDVSIGLPTPEQAEELLREAAARNPGPWEAHSRNAAEAARYIAERCPGMDPQAAHTMALLHDIGRRYGVTGMRHVIDGYRFLMEEGFSRAARICLTHTFEAKTVEYAPGPWDCTPQEYDFLDQYIQNTQFDEYDRLVQLCDTLADAQGFCLMEKRYIDVSLRRGVQPKTPLNWEAALENRGCFDLRTGGSVYRLLPGVIENTFCFTETESLNEAVEESMSCEMTGLPTPEQAEELLREAAARNPGPWEAHSRNAAEAARHIAGRCPGMDPQAAHTMALLHDIGRRFGATGMRHALDGYRYLAELGYDQAARACMLHSFPLPEMDAAFGQWDCTAEEYAFVENYIQEAVFDDYDRLIQICDALADANGLCLMEKRFIDVAIRHGVMEKAPPKWRAWLQTKAYFDEKIGCSLYRLLPGVVEGTFGFTPG